MNRVHHSRAAVPAALLILGLLTAGNALAIEVCGNGVCNPNGFPPETPQTCPADCGGTSSPPSPCTADTCTSCARPAIGADRDGDQVPDRLEHDLAHKFFPRVLLQWPGVDRDESYLFQGFATPYTLRPLPPVEGTPCDKDLKCLEIRYAIAFFRDHGDLATLDFGHLGDSEMYAAVLRRTAGWPEAQSNPNVWEMIRDFTSAHMNAASDSSRVGAYGFCPTECSSMGSDPAACNAAPACNFVGSCSGVHGGCVDRRTFSDCLAGGCNWNGGCVKASRWKCYDPLPKSGHVDVFSAERKHALYHTDAECDGGGWNGSDDCPKSVSTAFDLRAVKGSKLQNVGNVPNGAGFDVTIQHPDRCRLYNVWGTAKFGESTPYRNHFIQAIEWRL